MVWNTAIILDSFQLSNGNYFIVIIVGMHAHNTVAV